MPLRYDPEGQAQLDRFAFKELGPEHQAFGGAFRELALAILQGLPVAEDRRSVLDALLVARGRAAARYRAAYPDPEETEEVPPTKSP